MISKLGWTATWKGFSHISSTLRSFKKLVAEHYERDFDMIFNVKAAQNFAAERYGIDFDRIFLIMAA